MAEQTTKSLAGKSNQVFRWSYWEPHIYIMLLFSVFVVARYMQWGARRSILAAIRIEFIFGFSLMIICIGLLVNNAPLRFNDSKPVLIAIACLFAAMLIQLPVAANPEIARTIFFDRVIKFAMMTFFMAVLIQSPRFMFYFLLAFLFACFYVTQEAFRGLLSGSLVWQNQGIMRLHGAVPIYAHPNSLSGCAMGVIPFIVFLFPLWRKYYLRLGLLALLITAGACVLYSGSRTSYVAFLSFCVYWFAVSKKKIRWIIIATIVGAIGLTMIPEQYVERFKSIGGQEAVGHSKEKRMEVMSDALIIFFENPIGVGVACFPTVRMMRFGRAQDTHNLYLEVATNLGIQGFIVFIVLIITIMIAYRKAYKSYSHQRKIIQRLLSANKVGKGGRKYIVKHYEDIKFLEALCYASAGFIYVRLVLGFFGMDLYEVYWWFGTGMAISLLTLARKTNRKTLMLEKQLKFPRLQRQFLDYTMPEGEVDE